jgi:allophanate hydrolase
VINAAAQVKTADRSFPFDVVSLRRAYDEGTVTPAQIVERTLERIAADDTEGIWIHLRDPEVLRAEAKSLERDGNRDLALYGIPFAVKDNIDVAGVPTTAACPEYAYVPSVSAPVVERLRAQGALFVGKTNLDQFATGLVGVRSPYGTPPNPFDPRYISGGSSSGSAAAVARGHVPFALATDTAGSGRIPATFNNLVGFKPSRGLFSCRGVVPACRSRDCVSILTLTCADAREVASIATAFDRDDPYSSREADRFFWQADLAASGLRLAIPCERDLAFTSSSERLEFDRACARLADMGHTLVPIDMGPFFEAGSLLYDGPWIAERLSGVQDFLREHSDALLPVIRTILSRGQIPTGAEAFLSLQRLATLKRAVEPLWSEVTALVVPGAPEFPRIDEVLADPLETNARLGRYTTFGNLLDLAAVAVPSGFRADGLPAGIVALGPWGRDATLLALSANFHERTGALLGAVPASLPLAAPKRAPVPPTHLSLAVVGAHLTGQPLNHQLTDRGGVLVRTTRTSPQYRLYALANTQPAKPGLLRVDSGSRAAIEVEVWALPLGAVGSFLAGVRAPLCLGTIELIDGTNVHGFLCEATAVSGARDISSYGGWRAFLADG